ncbi:FGGY family carbohydrate kinase [Brachybacterium fresconis]
MQPGPRSSAGTCRSGCWNAYCGPMPSVLCLDLGTSAAKAALIDLDGSIHGRASCPYPTRTTADGGAEQDPQDWLRSARTAITELLHVPGATRDVLALSLTGQMQDLVLLDPDGAIAPAVLYSDTRAGQDAQEIHARLESEGISWDSLTATVQDATSCAAMFRRLVRTDPDLAGRARGMVFGPAGYLAHALGCGRWCDPTTAAATGLLEARTGTFSGVIARAASLDEDLLPALTTATGQVVGRTDTAAQDLLGVPGGVPIVLAPGDAGATTLGIVGLEVGDDYAYLGTSGWLAAVIPRTAVDDGGADVTRADVTLADRSAATAEQAPVSHHLALAAGDDLVLRISALLAAGAAADWARAALLGGASPAEADARLEEREARQGRGPTGLLALPSIHGERYPVRDGDLRAALVGMGPRTRDIDMYAAVLEGVAHALVSAISAPSRSDRSTGERSRPLAVAGGGTASAPWLRILADVTGREVRAVDGADAALVGCALAAADELGMDHSIRPLAFRSGGRTVAPDPSAARAHAVMRDAHRALYTAVAAVRALH